MTSFLDEMDQLATEIAKQAREAASSLEEKIAAFKALTPYWVQNTKRAGNEDDSDEGVNFDNFQQSIHSTETGHG